MDAMQKEAVHLIEYFRLIRKRLWLITLIFLIVFGTVYWGTLRQTPIYETAAEIMVGQDVSKNLLPGQQNFLFLEPFQSQDFETQKHIIKSQNIAEGVVDALHLADRENDPKAWKNWIARVRGALRVQRVSDTRIFRIIARSPSPERARDIANTAAKVYIEYRIAARRDASRSEFSRLMDTISDVEKKLEKSQLDLIKYVKEENVTSTLKHGTGEKSGMDLSIDTTGSNVLLQSLRAQIASADLKRSEILESYLEQHPKVKALDAEIERLSEKIRQEEENLIRLNEKAIRYRMLEQKASANRKYHEALVNKLEALDITLMRGGRESNVRVIEWAGLPEVPVSPKKGKNYTFGAIFGLLFGFGSAFLLEYFDRSIQTPEEAEKYLNVPVLSYLPRVKGPKGLKKKETSRKLFLLCHEQPKCHEAEMFKRLRTSVRFSIFSDDGSKALAITSSGPQEGKTTIVSNLGITLAQSGFRTVLVETDLRRPKLHDVFGCPKGPGIREYLEGGNGMEDILRPTSIENLSVVPIGSRPPNPAEVLESRRLPELVRELKNRYDYVLFDSPPAGSLADTSIMAPKMDGVLFVLYAGHMDRTYIQNTTQQLEKAGARMCGVILNNIDLGLRGYYYYYHYYKYYGGYHHKEGLEG